MRLPNRLLTLPFVAATACAMAHPLEVAPGEEAEPEVASRDAGPTDSGPEPATIDAGAGPTDRGPDPAMTDAGATDADPRPATGRAPPRPGDCPAALEPGAPAPMAGYCPTRAHRSAFEIAAAEPELRWALELPAEAGRWGSIVVAPGGRLYLPVADQTRLLAVDDRGDAEPRIAWELDVGGRFGGPVLLADGSLFVAARPAVDRREGLWLDRDGERIRRVELPPTVYGAPAVGEAGDLFFASRVGDYDTEIVAVDAHGGLRWRSAAVDRYPVQPAVGPGDRIVLPDRVSAADGERSEAWLMALDPTSGETAWRAQLDPDASIVSGPSIGPDGGIYAVLWTEEHTVTTLIVLEPDGSQRLRVELPEPPWSGGVSSLSIGADGTAFVKEGRSLMAIDPSGALSWRREAHPNIDIDGVIGAAGRMLVGSGAARAVDTRDGRTLWTSRIPAHQEPRPGGGVSISYAGPATVGDGVLYYMASDDVLHAAAP